MADSKRQQIISALDTRLKTIKTIAGYQTNLGNNVFEWNNKPLAANEMPGLIYRDVSNSRQEGAIGKFRWGLNVEIEIMTSGSTAAADVRKMLADVYKAIGTDVYFSALAVTTEQPESDEMQIVKEDKKIGGALIKLSIIYDAAKWEM